MTGFFSFARNSILTLGGSLSLLFDVALHFFVSFSETITQLLRSRLLRLEPVGHRLRRQYVVRPVAVRVSERER